MAELPERSDDLVLELLDHWSPVTECELPTHAEGTLGCRPEAKAEYTLRAVHGAFGVHEPAVVLVCVWHVIWIRANRGLPIHCTICHTSGTTPDFFEVIAPISHK